MEKFNQSGQIVYAVGRNLNELLIGSTSVRIRHTTYTSHKGHTIIIIIIIIIVHGVCSNACTIKYMIYCKYACI